VLFWDVYVGIIMVKSAFLESKSADASWIGVVSNFRHREIHITAFEETVFEQVKTILIQSRPLSFLVRPEKKALAHKSRRKQIIPNVFVHDIPFHTRPALTVKV
jgi:hypothetical protein